MTFDQHATLKNVKAAVLSLKTPLLFNARVAVFISFNVGDRT
jgi:hypothetical protein